MTIYRHHFPLTSESDLNESRYSNKTPSLIVDSIRIILPIPGASPSKQIGWKSKGKLWASIFPGFSVITLRGRCIRWIGAPLPPSCRHQRKLPLPKWWQLISKHQGARRCLTKPTDVGYCVQSYPGKPAGWTFSTFSPRYRINASRRRNFFAQLVSKHWHSDVGQEQRNIEWVWKF